RSLPENMDAAEMLITADVVTKQMTLQEKTDFRATHLEAYQSERLARRYRALVDQVSDPDLKEAVARGYHKVLAYKDEYEVARLLSATREKAEAAFEGDLKLTYNIAPPLLSRVGPDGRPMKRAFKGWIERVWPHLAKLKRLRGTPFDVFGYTAERRLERRLIRDYERDIKEMLKTPPINHRAAIELAELPLQIRGFGPVKLGNAEKAAKERESLKAALMTTPEEDKVA
ncbi:MAG: indolepyruvate ferredoxin oxidoreductase family protein, partial [Boseongicola sp.]|nr:indolepyruvate ferredoxin oxidoreductase family protein [Boseongicola sp.]